MDRPRAASRGRGVPNREPSTRSLSVSASLQKERLDAASLRTITTGSNETFQEDKSMFFAEMNPYAPETVVLLHVIFSCHLEWKEVWPKLPEYHLLMPDLPCHSRSKRVCRREDFSIERCADHVAEMIRAHAHDGRAHIVGISAGGGRTALQLAMKYPELVKSVFDSGAWPVTGFRLTVEKSPRLMYLGLWTLLHSPAGKTNFFKATGLGGEYYNDELFSEIRGNVSSRLAQANVAVDWDYDILEQIGEAGVRVLFVAAGTHDSPTLARKAGQAVNSQDNGEAYVYTITDAAHAWNLQQPALFAKSIRCWIERQPMPSEFKELSL